MCARRVSSHGVDETWKASREDRRRPRGQMFVRLFVGLLDGREGGLEGT